MLVIKAFSDAFFGGYMKYFIASDIHGSYYWADKMMDKFIGMGAERMICLGDILYHGPRNDLPKDYAPKKVIELMNSVKDRIWAVRGNCEAEVDQMVLDFPVHSDYAILALNGHTFFATHGHLYNEEKRPPLVSGDILLHGHTHLLVCEKLSLSDDGGYFYHLNPGSVSIPKGENPNSYAVLEGDCFAIYDFDGNIIKDIQLI